MRHGSTRAAHVAGLTCVVFFSFLLAAVADAQTVLLQIGKVGTGAGRVTSTPAGIDCGTDCTETYARGTGVELTAAPGPGSGFTGWGGACTGIGTCSVNMSQARTVTATFATFVLSVSHSGTGSVTSAQGGIDCGVDCREGYAPGTVVDLFATPAPGWGFAGWSGACSGTGNCSVTMTQARSVAARFAQFALTVSRSGNGSVTSAPGGIDCGADCREVYASGTAVQLTATPGPGWGFAGWSGACTGAGNCSVTMTQARNVTARFAQFTLSVSRSGNGSIASAPGGIDCGTDCREVYAFGTTVELMATPAAGWGFAGWSGACTGAGNCSVTMTQARNVAARFGQFALIVSRTGNGSVTSAPGGIDCGTDCREVYPSGTVVQLTATPAPGWGFAGWSGGCAGTGNCSVTMTQARTVNARFATFVLSVTRSGNGNGSVTSTPGNIDCAPRCAAGFPPGTLVRLTPIAAAGSSFMGWSGSCTGTGNCSVTMTQARAVVARFGSVRLSVTRAGEGAGTVVSAPPGIDCGETCGGQFPPGTLVQLTATPGAGSGFGGWAGACSGAGNCSVTLIEARAVVARFTRATLRVIRAGDGNGSVASSPAGIDCGVDCSESYAPGTQVTLTATPAGSRFAGWTGGGCPTAGDCTVTIIGNVTVTATFTTTGTPVPVRFSFVRTDGVPAALVYDAGRRLIFATNPELARVDVIAVDSARIVASIPVPVPSGIDIMPDGASVIVGTETQFLYVIDPATLTLRERVAFADVDPNPFRRLSLPVTPVALSNGTVLVHMEAPDSTATGLARWNPATGARVILPGFSGRLARSADHRRVVIASFDSGGDVRVYDADTDTFTHSASFFGEVVVGLAVNPDGTQYLVQLPSQLVFLDGDFQEVARRPARLGHGVYSADGERLYLSEFDIPALAVLDTTTFESLGRVPTTPEIGVTPISAATDPFAVDDTGLVFGRTRYGVDIVDASTPRVLAAPGPAPIPLATAPLQGSLVSPPRIALRGANFAAHATAGTSVIFGDLLGGDVAVSGDTIMVTPPPAPHPGPVPITIVFPDGWSTVAPEAFSYGPTVTHIDPTGGPAAGGTQISLLGYGFKFDASAIQVTVGGQAATVVEVQDTSRIIVPYPFPLLRLIVRVPAHAPGLADITVATPAGSTTVPRAFRYLVDAGTVPKTPAIHAQVVYDRFRDRVYISNYLTDRIDVFSVATGTFLAPFIVGEGPLGIALTPDGSRLAVAQYIERTVLLVDLDHPETQQRLPTIRTGDSVHLRPVTVATTSTGKVFVQMTLDDTNGCVGEIREIDPLASSVVTRDPGAFCVLSQDVALLGSDDGTRILAAVRDSSDGPVLLWEAETDAFRFRRLGGFIASPAIAGDGHRVAIDRRVLDEQLRLGAFPVYSTLHSLSSALGGSKLHASGSLLYVPTDTGVDVYDPHTGALRERYAVTLNAEFTLDGMTLDAAGKTLFVIADTGLTIVRLAQAPLGIGALRPDHGPRGGGTEVTIRGSGFAAGTMASFDGVTVPTTVVDENTLRIVAPPHAAGAVRVGVTNAGGERYMLDAAYRFDD